ncbi:hypothetical protein [Rhizobium sp. TRM95796]|uniref:hypothetical protein n=1 Tax=Rhizobium sp. TRM95796 TaxID=2979862 RepID=UPI0021E834C2|nr:hypothetical protein [Rhizobium sp. TRM95796]MCV3766625.1 hypothetical protein [Rhizobium sp. TRM95796]
MKQKTTNRAVERIPKMDPVLQDNFDKWLRAHRRPLDQHSDADIKQAIATEDFSGLIHLPPDLRRSIADNPDLQTDIWWYVEIRHELDIEDFPCIHIAYAISSKAKSVIGRSHGVFTLSLDQTRTNGLVIGFCPWCATPLNVSAS